MALDYAKLLKLGIEGILAEIAEARATLDKNNTLEFAEKNEFYDTCVAQLNAVLELEDRYVAEARSRGLKQIADIMEKVPRKPAETFHEALQSIHFYGFILRDLFSCGRPDQYLIDYYRNDIEAGRLTEERALELIDLWNIQYTFYVRPLASISYIIGGHAPDGTPVENELTWLFLQSIEHLRMAYPSVGLGVFDGMNQTLLDYSLELLANGYTHPALFNDVAIPNSLHNTGMPMEHAYSYVHSTCVEITPCYRSGLWATSPYHSCPQILMDMLKERRDFATFDELYEGYKTALYKQVREANFHQIMLQLERYRNGGESPLASVLVEDCIRRGKGIDQRGTIYNHVLPNFIGPTNVIDSLADINQIVFKEKKISLDEFYEILVNDFEGHEDFRQYLINKCPHFGNNEDEMDAFGKKFYQMLADSMPGEPTLRGGIVIPGCFAFMMHEDMGKACMATPDGRHAGEAFNAGSDPVSGRDINGPTASLLSTTEWDHMPFLGGVAVNIRLNTNDFNEEKLSIFRALVMTFMERNGFELQVTTVSPEILEDAIKNPEKHSDLLVRIGGFSDYFVRQTPQLQREIIARTYHEI
jgi:formate C-acetyltransferase